MLSLLFQLFGNKPGAHDKHRSVNVPLWKLVSSAVIERSNDDGNYQLKLTMKDKESARKINNILEMPFLTAITERIAPPNYKCQSISPTSITITGDLSDALTFLHDYEIIDSDSVNKLKEEIGSSAIDRLD